MPVAQASLDWLYNLGQERRCRMHDHGTSALRQHRAGVIVDPQRGGRKWQLEKCAQGLPAFGISIQRLFVLKPSTAHVSAVVFKEMVEGMSNGDMAVDIQAASALGNQREALITPPLGACLFVASSVGHVRFEDVAKAVLPFMIVELVVLLLLVLFPAISLTLPRPVCDASQMLEQFLKSGVLLITSDVKLEDTP